MKLFNQKSSTFKSTSSNLLSEVLFELLNPKPEYAKARFLFLVSLFFLFWIILIISSSELFNSSGFLSPLAENDALPMFRSIVNIVFAPQIIMRLFVCVIAFVAASLLASQYLKVVYQMPSIKTALNLLLSLSLGNPVSDIVKIEEGKISSLLKNSHILSFGGPGKIRVSFDSAAILENPTGEFEIIGPTAKFPNGTFLLKPYQKIQRIIDLRNQTISFDLIARTRDGLAISINKIQLTFSVSRSTKKVTLTRPYSFSVKDVYSLVFNQPDKEFCELVSDYAKTIILELFRSLSFKDLFHYEKIIDLQPENIHHPSIIGNKKKSYQFFLSDITEKKRALPKKAIGFQGYLWRPILHKPHLTYDELNYFKSKPKITLPPIPYQLNHLLTDRFKQEFSIRPGHPEVSLEWLNMGIWSPAYPPSVNKHTATLRSPRFSSSEFFSGKITDFSKTRYFNISNQISISENCGNISLLIEILNLLKDRAKGAQNYPKVDLDNLNSAITKLERIINENLPCKN